MLFVKGKPVKYCLASWAGQEALIPETAIVMIVGYNPRNGFEVKLTNGEAASVTDREMMSLMEGGTSAAKEWANSLVRAHTPRVDPIKRD